MKKWLATAWLAGSAAVTESPVFLLDYLLRALRVAVLLSLWRIVLGQGAHVAGPGRGGALVRAARRGVRRPAQRAAPRSPTRSGRARSRSTSCARWRWCRSSPPRCSAAGCVNLRLLLAAAAAGRATLRCRPAARERAPRRCCSALSLFLAILVGLAFDFITAALTVALEQPVWLVFWVRQAISVVLSGAVVPLALLPVGPRRRARAGCRSRRSPGRRSRSTPASASPLRLIALQVFWALVLWPLAGWLWRANREKVVGYGG